MPAVTSSRNKAWGSSMKDGESWKTGSAAKKERMADYLEWLITPPEVREPKTKTEFADKMGVSLNTLRNYSMEPSFQKELHKRQNELGRVEQRPDVMASLFRQATDINNPRSVTAAKVWLDHIERNLEAVTAEDVSEMQDEDLVAVATAILEKIANKNG